MAGPLRGMPSGSARSQGKRLVAAATSSQKQQPAKPTPARPSALQQANPPRLGPSAAEYSTRKRPRAFDADLDLEEDGLAPRPAQRQTVITPSSIAAACRAVKPPPSTLTQTIQVTPTAHNLFSSFERTATPAVSRGPWRQTQPRSATPLGYRRPAPGPSGLVNLGNTCYLNAVLQSLFSLPTFPSAVRAAATATRAAPGGVLAALAGALAQRAASATSGRSAFSPDAVKAAVSARQGTFRGALQHDAHEFFCGLLEAAQAEVLAAEAAAAGRPRLRASESVDPVTRVFGFAVEHRFTCSVCGHESSVVEECTHLSLDLPRVDAKNPNHVPPALDTLLDTYFAEESVEKACEGCGARSVAHSVLRRVRRLPRILTLHVKRFQVTLGSRGIVECNKLRTPVTLPQSLRVGPFCLDDAASPLPPLQPTQTFEKENRGDNAAKAASRAAAAAAAPAASSPAARHAVAGVRSATFYSEGYHDAMPPPAPPQPGYAERTFQRKGGKGAASVDYWDQPLHKKPMAKAFGDIVGAAGSPVGRHRNAGDSEEDAALARALVESAAEVAAKTAYQQDQEDEDLATAIKRSLEETQAQEAAAAALEPWMADAGLSGNNDWGAEAQEPPLPELKTTTAAVEANADADAAPLGPPLEIVEDDADVGELGGSQGSRKAEGVVVSNTTLPLVLSGAERVPNAPAPSRIRTYRLTAVIAHHGARAESGHFTADAKDAVTAAWHRFNDAHVAGISGADAVGPAAQRDCYVLFYSAN